MLLSILDSKGKVTIPTKVRHALKIKSGDELIFEICGHNIVIRKAEFFDYLYHGSLANCLNEWESPEDDKAYHDL